MLGEVESVVVAVPGEDAALAEFGGEFERRVIFDAHSERGAAFVEAGGVGDAVDLQFRNSLQAGHHSFEQSAFVLVDGCVGGLDGGAAARGRRWSSFARRTGESPVPTCSVFTSVCTCSHDVATQVGYVVHAGGDTGDAFVVERAPLPAIWNRVRVGANFVRAQALEVLALAEEHAHVWAEEFVG